MSGEMYKTATAKSTDQSALADIAMNAEDAEVRLTAVTRLTDPALLARVAMNDEEWHLHRMAAAERLKKLSGVACQDKAGRARRARPFCVHGA